MKKWAAAQGGIRSERSRRVILEDWSESGEQSNPVGGNAFSLPQVGPPLDQENRSRNADQSEVRWRPGVSPYPDVRRIETLENSRDNWVIVPNRFQPIIPGDLWNQARQIFENREKRAEEARPPGSASLR